MPVLSPAALESLDRKFIWSSPCSFCGKPAVAFHDGFYFCRTCNRRRAHDEERHADV